MDAETHGYQLYEKLKQGSRKKIPYVMLLTARGQKSDIEEGQSAGADSYLVKPFCHASALRVHLA